MASSGPWKATACVIALSSFAMTAPALGQPMLHGPIVLLPGPDGVLRLDDPRHRFAFDDGVISQRYLDSLPRRKARQPIADTRRTRTADAVPQTLPAAPAAQPAAPSAPTEAANPKSDTDALREQIARLGSETNALRAEVAVLKGELAKRSATSEQRSQPPNMTAAAGNDELTKVRDESARLREEISRLRGESDRLRELVAKLTADTGGLRGEIAALKDDLAKRPVDAGGTITGKVDQQVRPQEPLRRGDSLKKGSATADNKVAERAPGSEDREVERMASMMEKVWRRLLEMVGKPKDAP